MLIHIEDYFEMDNNNEILPYEIISTESFREEKRKYFQNKNQGEKFYIKSCSSLSIEILFAAGKVSRILANCLKQ